MNEIESLKERVDEYFDGVYDEVGKFLTEIENIENLVDRVKAYHYLTDGLITTQIDSQTLIDNHIDKFINDNCDELIEMGYNEREAIQRGLKSYTWSQRKENLGESILFDD